jgi:hypothetical protein
MRLRIKGAASFPFMRNGVFLFTQASSADFVCFVGTNSVCFVCVFQSFSLSFP